MKIELIVSIISILISGVFGFFIKWFIDKRSEKESRSFERKEERYQKLLNLSIELYREKNPQKLRQCKSNLLHEYDFCWLYAADEVILKFSEFIESLANQTIDSEKSMKYLSEAIILMRKDLGNNTKLTPNNWKPRNPD